MVETAQVAQPKKAVKIGDYVITGKIGRGGVAEIYKARQESLDRDVAIKILSSKMTEDQDIVRRFERESLVIARLNHPNIVHIIDRGKASGRYYFVMEYINGTSLREVIDSPKILLRTKLEMIVQVCKALDYAHKNGVIHRDIKPTNVLVDRQGNAMVSDFGIAQMVCAPDSEMTSSDIIMGTLAYMSPEQKISSARVDQTTDIYAVGVMLYEILVGNKPQGHFKLPSEINGKLPKEFDEIILKCLAQEAKDRYQRAVELKDAVLNVIIRDESGAKTDSLSLEGTDSFLGKCRYLDTIKETRFGSTILVENRVNKKLYVIKKHGKGEAGRKEAKVLGTLKHPNIIDIYGSGGDTKSTVIIIDYAQGGSLADRMVRKYRWDKAFGIITAVASGLHHAHKNNIIHGNLRPSNILFDADDVVKITDFGLPAHYENPRKKNWYMPPERKKTRQGDIYSLGVIAHQMITGRNPSYDTASNLLLHDVKMQLPEDVQRMLAKLLAIRVTRRYKSCDEFLLDFEEYEHQREARKQAPVVKEEPDAPTGKNGRLWMYVTIGAGLLAGILAVLYVANIIP
ncbi:MAG: serine/threonine protein kinase [Candidatus Zixiibacteriota bacterium]|nr:MAG: serine/threonine protein kinase [candidate division Zixibacteria bacterium]